jgi:hypothetical protein
VTGPPPPGEPVRGGLLRRAMCSGVHDYHDELTGVLAAALARRAPGYTSLGFPDPRRLARTPSANLATRAQGSDAQLR